jgi:hypothetical protein
VVVLLPDRSGQTPAQTTLGGGGSVPVGAPVMQPADLFVSHAPHTPSPLAAEARPAIDPIVERALAILAEDVRGWQAGHGNPTAENSS